MEKRAAKLNEMRELATGEQTPEKRTAFDKIEKEVEAVNTDIRNAQTLAEFERVAENGTPVDGTPDYRREASRYSLTRALAHASGLRVDAAREIEVSQEIENRSGRKAQGIFAPDNVFQVRRQQPFEQRVVTSGGDGAGLIFEQGMPGQYIDALRANLVTARLGATTLSGLQGNVSVPKLNASADSEWVAENGALTAADGDWDKVTMTPKHVGALTEFSRNMLLQSSPDIEQLIRRDFAASLAVALDAAALVGGGSNEPDGIITLLTAGPGLSTLAGPTWAQVLGMIAEIELANAAAGSLGWTLNPKAVQTLRSKPKVEYGSPVSDSMGGFIMDGPNELAGYAAASTTSLPQSLGSPAVGSAIFGDWSSLLIGYWSGVDILANPYSAVPFSKGNTQVRALMTADIAVRGTDRFTAATDIPAAT
ncbi:phage major capsid protein [Hyphomonas sp.]|uniref:phage major capsid protein n=1 Tax=Hyphomonas sp. TaxID=87 RepID=UPI0032EB6861